MRQCRAANTTDSSFTGVYGPPLLETMTARTIPIPASRCTRIPSTARAYALNATVIPGGSEMPFLTVWPAGQPRPDASVINAFGQTISAAFLVPAGTNGAVDVYAFRRTELALEISGYSGR